jgi:hypothetical protein
MLIVGEHDIDPYTVRSWNVVESEPLRDEISREKSLVGQLKDAKEGLWDKSKNVSKFEYAEITVHTKLLRFLHCAPRKSHDVKLATISPGGHLTRAGLQRPYALIRNDELIAIARGIEN